MIGNPQQEVQVYFLFERTGEWPPVPSEGLRAEPVEDGYRVLETPFFVRNVGLHDVVRAEDDGSGVLWAGERVSWGGHQTLRVNPRRDTGGPSCAAVLAEFAALGAVGEELEEYEIVALDVPPGVAVPPILDLLRSGRSAQRWWYEEACIDASWPDDAATGA